MEPISRLREICQSPDVLARYDPNRYRKVSIYFTKFFLLLNLSANNITVLSLFVGLFSSLLFATGNPFFLIFGALLLHFFMILDCCDGEVARYTKQSSESGVFLDKCIHQIVTPSIFMGIAVGVFINMNAAIWLFIGIATSFAIFLNEIVVLENKLFGETITTDQYSKNIGGRGVLVNIVLFFYSSFRRVDLISFAVVASLAWMFVSSSFSFLFDPMLLILLLYFGVFAFSALARILVSFKHLKKEQIS